MKKKIEFSKLLVSWALIITTACIACSYILSFTNHDPCSEITGGIVTTCIAIAVSYEAKSFGEKHSRNRFGLDENGKKISAISHEDEPIG